MSQVCSIEIPQGCSVCYEASFTNASTIDTGISLPAGSYYLWIRDQFGNLYNDPITIASNGNDAIINTANFRGGMFNQYAGAMDLFISTDSGGQDLASFTISGTSYNCLIFEIEC